jgi:hypothetical protein
MQVPLSARRTDRAPVRLQFNGELLAFDTDMVGPNEQQVVLTEGGCVPLTSCSLEADWL